MFSTNVHCHTAQKVEGKEAGPTDVALTGLVCWSDMDRQRFTDTTFQECQIAFSNGKATTMSKNVVIANVNEIPAAWGPFTVVQKRTEVMIRTPESPSEAFALSWGNLTATPEADVVIYTEKDAKGYPCKKDIFAATYKETAPGSGRYRKTETNRIIQVPAGDPVVLKTLEGDETVPAGDFVAIGKKGEVYAQKKVWVDANLDIVGSEPRS